MTTLINDSESISAFNANKQATNFYHLKFRSENNNLLISSANNLLKFISRLRLINKPPANIEKIRHSIIKEIKNFEQKAKDYGYETKIILAARYSLCTALDEAVLQTSWGTQSIWIQQTLLSILYKETWGGERFYLILNNALEQPEKNIDLLELFYILLSLGFEGKYYQNKAKREELREKLFHHIQKSKPEISKDLSPYWKATDVPAKHVMTIPFWVIIVFSITVLIAIAAFVKMKDNQIVLPLVKEINKISN